MDRFLVSTEWLEANLGDPELRVFDCTTKLVPDPNRVYRVESGREDYQAGHIPGAAFIDLQGELSERESRLRFTMPQPAQFGAAMSAHGVGPGAKVVLYSSGAIFWATRVWWMLRAFSFENAAVLDGGLEKWSAEARPLSREPSRYLPARFEAHYRPELIATVSEVRKSLSDPHTCIVNALSPRQHSGESRVHYGRPGRIAGSVNVPANELIDPETHRYLAPESLRERLAARGVLAAERVITYCGGGIAASSDAFALALLGHPNVALYDGSLSEWAPDPSLPMETGPGSK